MVPEGWRSTKLGELFTSRREKGVPGLPTISVTLNDGLVLRDSLDRNTETTLTASEHLLVRKGDIAYNMMRMWQGASGLAEFDALVSPAYIVLRPKKAIDPPFASYLLKSPRMKYLLWAYSYGLTKDRLRLYFRDFSLIPVNLPPVEEQRRIGSLLRSWDRAIETVEKLIENSEAQTRSLMQRVLSGSMRFPDFGTSKWNDVTLGQITSVVVSNVDKKSQPDQQTALLCNYTDVYRNSHITSGLPFMRATATRSQFEKFALRKGDVLITKDSEQPDDIAVPAVVDEDLPGVLCGYHLALLRPKPGRVDGQFLGSLLALRETQHYFLTRANGATRFGLTIDAIRHVKLQIPSLEEQTKIARMLRASQDATQNYRLQLARLQKQKKGLMQQLLTGRRRVKPSDQTEVLTATG